MTQGELPQVGVEPQSHRDRFTGGRCIWAQTPAISQSVETYCCSRGATLGWEHVTPEKLRTISAQSR
ncbi:hypothetical protein VZH09_13650 [Synechococcus elongatus IITB7]|uniref:hypothetical protein n=1 Tax=Synechococcus elongatus TaxID=32046 RepID=UPI0030CF67B2